ncbi:MAG: nucleotidyltransferase family protein [Ruminiclostridium sp.]|nr:nucleotidyltransferase family protein [Ruminiclostridium sp.]
MKAVIIAAGYATRLYPLTMNRPKALLTINGKPIIDYICDEIDTIDIIDEILVVSNHKFINNFLCWVCKRTGKKKIKLLDDGSISEEDRLGAIGDIKFVLDKENIKDDVLIVAGDNFFTYKLLDFYKFFLECKKDCIAVHEVDRIEDLKRMGVVKIDENARVIDFAEKPENPQSNIAVYASYIYLKDTLPLFDTYLREGNKPDAPGYFPAWLCLKKDIFAFSFDGECYDIGTHEALSEVRKKFRIQVK